MGWGGCRSEPPGGGPGARCSKKGLENRWGRPHPPSLALLVSLQDIGLLILRGLRLRPSPRPPPKDPRRCPSLPPPLLLSTAAPPPSRVFSVHGLGLAACASANTPTPPIRAELRGEGPEAPLPACGRRGQRRSPGWVGGGRQGPSLRPARSGHSAHLGWGAGSRASGEGGGPVRAGAGSGWAQAGSGAGSQVTTPRGAGGGPRFGRVGQPREGRAHITGAAAGRRRRALLGCRVSCPLLLLRRPPA